MMFSFLLSLFIMFVFGWFIWRRAARAWALADAKDTLDKIEHNDQVVKFYSKVKAKQEKENVNANT